MDGIHDLGGKQGFGRVAYPSSPHDENWEPLVRALSSFAMRKRIYNMDEFRHAIERMAPRHYLTAPYYERHLTALATLLVEKGCRHAGGTGGARRRRVSARRTRSDRDALRRHRKPSQSARRCA